MAEGHRADLHAPHLSLRCLSSSKPASRLSDIALELHNSREGWENYQNRRRFSYSFEYANRTEAETRQRLYPQPSVYGDGFQHAATGRSASIDQLPYPRQYIDGRTYQSWPGEFTKGMICDYEEYKADSGSVEGLKKNYKEDWPGNLNRRTEGEREEMLECWTRTFNQELGRVEASIMILAHNQSVFWQATRLPLLSTSQLLTCLSL